MKHFKMQILTQTDNRNLRGKCYNQQQLHSDKSGLKI